MKKIYLYAAFLYAVFLTFGCFLKYSHAEEANEGEKKESAQEKFSQPFRTELKHFIAGRIPEPARSCREYLTTCERSCSSRGDMYRFFCLGQNFNPDAEHYRCQCGDDAFQAQASSLEVKK